MQSYSRSKFGFFSRCPDAVSHADHESGVSFRFSLVLPCENRRLLRRYEITQKPKKKNDRRFMQRSNVFNVNQSFFRIPHPKLPLERPKQFRFGNNLIGLWSHGRAPLRTVDRDVGDLSSFSTRVLKLCFVCHSIRLSMGYKTMNRFSQNSFSSSRYQSNEVKKCEIDENGLKRGY